MNFGCILNKNRRIKDENNNPSKMIPANKLKRKGDLKLSESLITNTKSSYPRNRKKVLTPLDLSEGDKVFVKSNDRSFHEAIFVKKSQNHFIIKLKNGDDIRVEGTKLRLVSQPSRSSITYDEPTTNGSLISSSPIYSRQTRSSTKKMQTNIEIKKNHLQHDKGNSSSNLEEPIVYESDSASTAILDAQSNNMMQSNDDLSCDSVNHTDLSKVNSQSENEKPIAESDKEMGLKLGEKQQVIDAVNCACGTHDYQQEMNMPPCFAPQVNLLKN
ncbi:hypothetical protein MXB_1603 [Myxobolus squamalis]|nr:hypothetical protein MXB_1603 [Myxobolus squamalis]